MEKRKSRVGGAFGVMIHQSFRPFARPVPCFPRPFSRPFSKPFFAAVSFPGVGHWRGDPGQQILLGWEWDLVGGGRFEHSGKQDVTQGPSRVICASLCCLFSVNRIRDL